MTMTAEQRQFRVVIRRQARSAAKAVGLSHSAPATAFAMDLITLNWDMDSVHRALVRRYGGPNA
ncbi:hypothetical protein ABI_08920 [Asticcacaulis biprosthecium C19]|uniref:Uncharacterized protein n=1 Tax=Asticcacaulis biprosthecium C19 TaxID=715226 RepID=F4QGC8_9CAUL|nr:hypothetical protein [Asticcacaulis biprosthecium]EGF92456.1 hypothetical protein ABI_08920 [Asticcacaulis biprosthecium C19]